MCNFKLRVKKRGHYTKTLWNPCEEAKKAKKVCESSSEDASTTGGFCYEEGCDEEPGGRREGPNDITNGGFDPDDVNWNEF
ncbi:hypothetical protein G7Y89_g1015 [Cudoniella acicularis]|uniref:Uncharacterized protein n=1 Tax=Cudoniella acicularis TaxID=354080 RepID=A0A8H4RW27_9HELO|nr:hypothetical protein G7Y89_g1015 [Cudoniella acicularis]